MRKSTHTALFASLAVLAVSGAPLAASGASSAADAVMEQSTDKAAPSKKDVIASWPAEKQIAYAKWPTATQDYYWTLSLKRQKLFWGLADSDKVTLSGMSADEQAKAWANIEGGGGAAQGSDR
jgi:hypothetical protein